MFGLHVVDSTKFDQHVLNDITQLRQKAYGEAKGFSVDLNTLRWQESDDQSHVVVVTQAQRIVATMRGELIASHCVLEQELECPWTYPPSLKFPTLLLSRAATLPEFAGHGLNLWMRYWFLKFAMDHNIDFMIGTFVQGSPRESTLRQMGYQFFSNDIGWTKSTYRSHQPVHVVCLDVKKSGEQAKNFCQDHLSQSLIDAIL